MRNLLFVIAANFLLILGVFFVLPVRKVFQGPQFMLLFLTLFVFGLALTLKTRQSKLRGKARKFLLLAGLSSTCIFPSIIIHNMTSALFNGIEEPVFFLLAIVVLPTTLLIGLVGSAFTRT